MIWVFERRLFFLGMGTWAVVNCLIQDWLGLEGYISYVRAHWMNIPWQVWPFLLALNVFLVERDIQDKHRRELDERG